MQKIPYIAALLTLAIHAAAYPVKFSFPKDAGEDQTSGLGRIHFFHSDPEQEKRDKEYQAKLERAEAFIRKVEFDTFERLRIAGADEIGDESDIDVEKESSPMQRVAELIANRGHWHDLADIKGIVWEIDDEPVPHKARKKLRKAFDHTNEFDGRSRLIGFPKYKRQLTVQLGYSNTHKALYGVTPPRRTKRTVFGGAPCTELCEYRYTNSIGGDTGNAWVKAGADNHQRIARIWFESFHHCENPALCEKSLRRQFKVSTIMEPITEPCPKDEPDMIIKRYYRLAIQGKPLFLLLYANESPQGSFKAPDGITVITLYTDYPADSIGDSQCTLLPAAKSWQKRH